MTATPDRVLTLFSVLVLGAGCAGPMSRTGECLPADRSEPAVIGPSVGIYHRSPTEIWVYDSRTELGIGVHRLDSADIAQIEPLGVRIVRITMYWGVLEPRPDRYSRQWLERWDSIVARAERADLELEVVVHSQPGWVGGFERRDSVYADFAEFMGEMAARYPGVRFWELWNEMDVAFTDVFGAGRDDVPMRRRGRYYAQMLELAYPAIKRANPDAWVLTGGMVNWTEFPAGIYEGGGAPYFDFMNLHTYGVPLITSYRGRGLELDSVMRAHGDTARPIWNTEFGIQAGAVVDAWGMPHGTDPGVNDGDVFDRIHCQSWKEALEYSRRDGVYVKALGYQLHAENESLTERIDTEANLAPGLTAHDFGFGLFRADEETPRPTYRWLEQRQYNAPIIQDSVQVVDVPVRAAAGLEPEGYESYRTEDGWLVIEEVRVGSLVPTVVRLVERPE